MANAMEEAFKNEWPNFMGGRDLPAGEQLKAMRHIFVAVAQGVVRHLAENAQSFEVDVAVTDGSGSGEVSNITTNP